MDCKSDDNATMSRPLLAKYIVLVDFDSVKLASCHMKYLQGKQRN